MLQGTLVFLVLVVLAVAGAEAQRKLARHGIQAPSLEGLIWLVVGLAAGGAGSGLFPDDVLAVLRSVVLLGLAWIGLMYGLQIDLAVIRTLKGWHRSWGLGMPTATGAAITAAGILLGLGPPLAIGVGSVAAVSATASLEAVARQRQPRDRAALRLVRMVAAFSGIPAILGVAVASVIASPMAAGNGGAIPAWELAIGLLCGGAILGYTQLALVRGLTDPVHLLTVLIGVAAVLAGIGGVMGLSALPAAAVAGTVVINRCVFPHRLLRVAHAFERPLMVAMLVLVGASIDGVAFSWRVFALLTVVRLGVLVVAGGALAWRAGRAGTPVTTRLVGLGLASQEAVALGLAVAVSVLAGPGNGLLEATVTAMIANQLITQWWLRGSLLASASTGESR